MKIIGIMPVRNEAWVLGASFRAALMWMDEIVIGLHACTDDTASIAREVAVSYPDRVHICSHYEQHWPEMEHRHALLMQARKHGATHIAIIDADEIATANVIDQMRSFFARLDPKCLLQLPWLQLRGSLNRYHVEGVWAQQSVSCGFVDAPDLHWSSSGRGGYDFHHRQPMGRALVPWNPIPQRTGGVMHLQMVSGRRLRAKQALYQMVEVLRWPGRETPDQIRRKYSLAVYGQENPPRATDAPLETTLREVPPVWWEGYADILSHIDVRALPWQEDECYRLLKEHGPRIFQGLDLFGIGDNSFHARA